MLEARRRAHCSGRGAACASTFAPLCITPELMESEAFRSTDADQLCLQVLEHRP